jgi:hypothetical protein
VHEAGADVAAKGSVGGETRQDVRTAGVVSLCFAQRHLEELGHFREGWRDRHPIPGEQEEHVGALDSVRDLGEERLQDRARAFALAGKEVQLGGLETPTATRRCLVRWRQCGRELRQLGRSCARPAPRRERARVVQLAGDGRVRSVRRECEVAGALLAIGDRLGERPVRPAPR